jgi:hypothetical protein
LRHSTWSFAGPSAIGALFCSTGQHREMLKSVFQVFDFAPDFELDVMTPNQALHELTARLVLALDEVYRSARPTWSSCRATPRRRWRGPCAPTIARFQSPTSRRD